MFCKRISAMLLAVLLAWLTGCASSPAPSPVLVVDAGLKLQKPPAAVMDSEIPDYPAWLERILSSSMVRLGLISPDSPPQPTTRAKP